MWCLVGTSGSTCAEGCRPSVLPHSFCGYHGRFSPLLKFSLFQYCSKKPLCHCLDLTPLEWTVASEGRLFSQWPLCLGMVTASSRNTFSICLLVQRDGGDTCVVMMLEIRGQLQGSVLSFYSVASTGCTHVVRLWQASLPTEPSCHPKHISCISF